MSDLWCIPNDAGTAVNSTESPGPTGVNDAAEPFQSPDQANVCLPGRTPGATGVNDEACRSATPQLTLPTCDVDCSRLSPESYMRLYRRMDVPYIVDLETHCSSSATADVHIYVNDGLSNRQSNSSEKSAIQQRVRRCAREGARSAIATNSRSVNVAVAHAYYGKAAPWEFRIYLSYALTYGRTTASGLSTYCDSVAKLGVDCSGFVNSFLVARGIVARARSIDTYEGNAPRLQAGDIRPHDLLVWQNSDGNASRHIAIVSSVNTSGVLRIAESSGSKGGLAASNYQIVSAGRNGIYEVHRGRNERGNEYANTSSVKIVPPI